MNSASEESLIQELNDLRSVSFFHGSLVGALIGLLSGILLGFVWSSPAEGKESSWGLGVKQVDFSYEKFLNKKSPLLPDIPTNDWSHRVSISPQLTFLKAGFFDSTWYCDTAYKKVMEAGLHFDLGIRVSEWLAVSYAHWSYHSTDRGNSMDAWTERNYGLEDSIKATLSFKP